ncbi:orotidine-5'-phosphate decarboxylase [Candidatus Peribacteria bacterium]|nr:orotidine-5'-phosphate decarboxylase [Candidatus Peribacteria bacterium]
MTHFADTLSAHIQDTSPVCVGLDPALDKLPEGIARNADGVEEFCRGIVDAVASTASCVKPQLAYFESLGWEGMRAFWNVCDYAKTKGLIVIADGKRNDIGSTCDAYAEAYLGAEKPVDALTVNPYLGFDGIAPFIERAQKNDKGLFVLVKTSNASSGELQDLPLGDEVVHEHVAQLVTAWGKTCLGTSGFSAVGAVVGATYPEELSYLRSLLPHAIILIPGYGAQGGTAKDVAQGFHGNGTGAIVNASRSIIYASKGKDWKEAAGKAVDAMAKDIAKAIG